jgi:hypothetical protein
VMLVFVVPSSSCGDELSSSTSSQTSKGCGDPPGTPAPAAPETETDNTRPDVIPPLYDDLNTLSREVFLFQLSFAHHVLEGPTPVESAPETQEQEVCTLYIDSYSTCTQTFNRTFSELTIPPFTARVQRQIFHFTLWWTRVKRKRRRLFRPIQLEM